MKPEYIGPAIVAGIIAFFLIVGYVATTFEPVRADQQRVQEEQSKFMNKMGIDKDKLIAAEDFAIL